MHLKIFIRVKPSHTNEKYYFFLVLNITGFPLVTSIGLVVLTLRVVSLPVYVLSEKLVAKRVKMDELINTTIIEVSFYLGLAYEYLMQILQASR